VIRRAAGGFDFLDVTSSGLSSGLLANELFEMHADRTLDDAIDAGAARAARAYPVAGRMGLVLCFSYDRDDPVAELIDPAAPATLGGRAAGLVPVCSEESTCEPIPTRNPWGRVAGRRR
jgi:hypothetical protein